MISNYLKIIVRNLFKSPVFSIINIAGLASGLSCAIFILLWVTDELKFDTFHANGPRLYRVMETQFYSEGQVGTGHSTPGMLAQALKDEVPEVEMASMMTWNIDQLVTVGTASQKESARYVDADFLRMFSYRLAGICALGDCSHCYRVDNRYHAVHQGSLPQPDRHPEK